jgi:ribosome-associated heat shock protein Hsp15
MDHPDTVRIDKFLWAVRLYRTRSKASEECRKGRISVNDKQVKSSGKTGTGDIIKIRRPPAVYTYRIIQPAENRMSAKLVSSFIEDLTPEEERLKTDVKRTSLTGYRKKGSGRPTKKERRVIDKVRKGLRDSGKW